MDLGIEDKVALVLGAQQGVSGAGSPPRWPARAPGWRSRAAPREALERAAAEIDGEVSAFVADTADLERLGRLPAEVAEALGPVEILVTNTGGPPPGAALDAELDAWREAYDSLILAPRVLIGATLPGMRERGWGRIVNVGSSATREPIGRADALQLPPPGPGRLSEDARA